MFQTHANKVLPKAFPTAALPPFTWWKVVIYAKHPFKVNGWTSRHKTFFLDCSQSDKEVTLVSEWLCAKMIHGVVDWKILILCFDNTTTFLCCCILSSNFTYLLLTWTLDIRFKENTINMSTTPTQPLILTYYFPIATFLPPPFHVKHNSATSIWQPVTQLTGGGGGVDSTELPVTGK